MQIAEPLQILIDELNKLPSIGKKTAQRLALYILKNDREYVDRLTNAMIDVKEKIHFCSICFNLATDEICSICANPKRDKSLICVVEEASDIIAIEKTNEYNGLYHVLGGVLNPLDGIGPDTLKIAELLNRIKDGGIKEIVLALNPDAEGDSTSLFIAKLITPYGIKITRIARGLPIGSNLEYADEATIGRAFLGRISV
ncbi:MAG: recombination mediator RecR [Ignavibacteriaceae bacterium]|jgi:recombination protein RecR|nr:recombination mediator RecR [Ignavibacteriaceae bacterium]